MSRTLHIATDGSFHRDRYGGHGAASFVALEDKMAFYDPLVKIPPLDKDIHNKTCPPNYRDSSFIPEFVACSHALEYAQTRMEQGVYDKVDIYTDNKAALALSKYIMKNGPLRMTQPREQLGEIIKDDDIYESCVKYTLNKNLNSSPLRHVFTNLTPSVRHAAQRLGDLSARMHVTYPHDDRFHFEHVKSHNEAALPYMDAHDAIKTELNSMADKVATHINSGNHDPRHHREFVKDLNHDFNRVMYAHNANPGWGFEIDANLAHHTSDPKELDMVSNNIFIADEIAAQNLPTFSYNTTSSSDYDYDY